MQISLSVLLITQMKLNNTLVASDQVFFSLASPDKNKINRCVSLEALHKVKMCFAC